DLLQGNQDLDEMEEQRRKGIKYCTLSEEDVKNISEVYVSQALDYDCSGETPIMGGLYDPHMGPANDTLICLTCYGNFRKCQGHYGYLHLVEPVYHVGYLTMVEGILKCICKECSRILLNNDICTNYLKKMKGGTIKKDPNGRSFLYHNDTILYPDMALFLLKEMVDEDRELLCVSEKPEKLFISTISVPPLAVRPSLPLNLRLAREDYLTERLKKIIKANEILTKHVKEYVIKQRDLDSPIYKRAYENLQFEVDQYMNSDDQQGQPLPAGLVQRLRGKQGRIRGTLSRKNVNYSGRTVISPDPYLKITEVRHLSFASYT
ncbi:DNA-directed RNA polymerase subunit a, partial [Trifolium pratense]